MEALSDMRALMELLEDRGELVRVRKRVSAKYELAAIVKKVQDSTGQAIFFEDVDGKMKAVANLYGGRDKIGSIFGVGPDETASTLAERGAGSPLKPVILSERPKAYDVFREKPDIGALLPVPWNWEKDAAPFFTSAVVVVKDPDTGIYNTSIHRIQLNEGNKLGIQLVPNQHLTLIQEKCEQRGVPLEVAILDGTDPYLFIASTSKIPMDADEYEYAGALKGKPLELVRCHTVNLEVPANTEIVMEGVIPPGVREPEGPMAEVLEYYGGESPKQIVEVSALYHREDPIFQTILGGTIEEHAMLGVPTEADLLERLKRICPLVKKVTLLPFIFRCVVQVGDIPVGMRGVAKNVLTTALSHPWIKMAVIVNEDVDIEDAGDLLWAINTRVDYGKDIVLIHGAAALNLDPMTSGPGDTIVKIGFDATVDPLLKDNFLRRQVVGLDEVDLTELTDAAE
jgi:2,5-furandicarboxylate decarboxylase 1